MLKFEKKKSVAERLNQGLPRQKQHSTRDDSFHQQTELKFKEETSKVSYRTRFKSQLCMVLTPGHFGKYFRIPWKIIKCAPEEDVEYQFGR